MSDWVARLRHEDAHMLRDALLACEWAGWNHDGYDPCGDRCPVCEAKQPYAREMPETVHRPGCRLDTALYNAGLPDQASRDAARAEIARRK